MIDKIWNAVLELIMHRYIDYKENLKVVYIINSIIVIINCENEQDKQ